MTVLAERTAICFLVTLVFGPFVLAQVAQNDQLLRRVQELYRKGLYAEGEILARRALSLAERTSGRESLDVAASLNNLAELCRAQGKYIEAQQLYERSLAILEKMLGSDDPSIASLLNNLAGSYRAQGRDKEAEPLYKRSLAIDEKSLGPSDAAVARDLNNLASLYQAQGKYTEAEAFYKRSADIVETLGPNDPNLAINLNNLAGLYRVQGRESEAEPLLKRALGISQRALGDQHPLVASCLRNLATLYRVQGKYSEAEALYRRSLEIMRKTLGASHPETIATGKELAGNKASARSSAPPADQAMDSWNLEQLEAAVKLQPNAHQIRFRLGQMYDKRALYAEAREQFLACVRLKPDYRPAYEYLALLYEGEQKQDEAIAAYRKAIELEQQQSSKSEWPYLNYGILLSKLHRNEESVTFLEQAVRKNPSSAKAQFELGRVYLQAGRLDAARSSLLRVIELDPTMPRAHYFLGNVYHKLDQKEKAEEEWAQFEQLERASQNERVRSKPNPRP